VVVGPRLGARRDPAFSGVRSTGFVRRWASRHRGPQPSCAPTQLPGGPRRCFPRRVGPAKAEVVLAAPVGSGGARARPRCFMMTSGCSPAAGSGGPARLAPLDPHPSISYMRAPRGGDSSAG